MGLNLILQLDIGLVDNPGEFLRPRRHDAFNDAFIRRVGRAMLGLAALISIVAEIVVPTKLGA